MEERHLVPWYPAWGIEFQSSIDNPMEIVSTFNEWRPNNRWTLMAYSAAASEVHLWTTWFGLRRREERGSMVARSVDAEFLRLIAGTHQVKIAFEKAGLKNGDDKAWIIHIPSYEANDEFGSIPIKKDTYNDNDIEAQRLIEHLDARLLTMRPIPTKEGLHRIGAIEENDVIEPSRMEDNFLLHSAMADM